MRCDIQETFPVTRVAIQGSWDYIGAQDVHHTLIRCLAEQPAAVVIRLDNGIPTEGMRALARVVQVNQRWPRAALILHPVTEAETADIRAAGLARHLRWFSTEAQAVAVASAEEIPLLVRHHLVAAPDAAALARDLVADACLRWAIPDVIEVTQLIASELISNAVLRTRTPLELTIGCRAGRVDVAVRDGDPRPPRRWSPGEPAGAARRGLLLLDAFARSWGCLSYRDGKVVWATLAQPA